MVKSSTTRYKSWAIQYNYNFDTLDGEGNPKNPDPMYFTQFNPQKQISPESWINWRQYWINQRIIFGEKQAELTLKAINKGYPDFAYNPKKLLENVVPKNQKTKDQKYGLLIGSSHDSDLKTDDKDKTKLAIKPLHLHFDVLLDAGITYSKAIKLFQPSRDENLKNVSSKNKYTRYQLHASESAFEGYKYVYGEDHLMSNLPDAFTQHCVYHYLALGKTKNSVKKNKEDADEYAKKLADKVSAGIITAKDAINRMKLKFEADAVDNARSLFKNAQQDYLTLLFDKQKQQGRHFELTYIHGLGRSGKSDLAEAIPKFSDPYHRFFPTTVGGSRKTTDLANGWQGEPQLVIQEMSGQSEDFRTLDSLFDPDHASMASSRNANVQLAVDRAYISNSAPETKWVLDNLESHAKFEHNDTRVSIIEYLRRLNLQPDEIVNLDKIDNETYTHLINAIATKYQLEAEKVAYELSGTEHSTSDSLIDWAMQLVRRFTYNIEIVQPHHFIYNPEKQYRQTGIKSNDSLGLFDLNQRVTEVHKLSELDAYLSSHNDLFHLPNLLHEPSDFGAFLEATEPAGVKRTVYENSKKFSLAEFLDPMTGTSFARTFAGIDADYEEYQNAKKYVEEVENAEKLTYNPEKLERDKKIKNSIEIAYANYNLAHDNQEIITKRIASYNLALASAPLFADDPLNDSLIVISKFDSRVKRLVTGAVVGLSHCEDYEEYRKNVQKTGIAIAKIQGTYKKEASDYVDPATIEKQLLEIAVNGREM